MEDAEAKLMQGRMIKMDIGEGAARPELRRPSRHGGMEPANTMGCWSLVVVPQISMCADRMKKRRGRILRKRKKQDRMKKRRGRILRKRKKQGNGTVDRVQELLQKIHAAFLNRNFVEGSQRALVFVKYGDPYRAISEASL